MGVYIRYQYQLFAFYSHNHKGRRSLIQRDYFIYEKRMVVLMQVQNIIRFIEYIQRSKPYANQFWDAFNANISYSFNVEAVYLPSQRSYLLKQGNVDIRVVSSISRAFIGTMHSPKRPHFGIFILCNFV